MYLLYDGARWTFVSRPAEARQHAAAVIGLERSLHIAVEASLQRSFSSGIVGWLLANTYLVAQLIVLPATLVYLYRTAPNVYRPFRNTVAVTWMASVPIFAVYPVAPPRLAGIGIRDTVSHQAGISLTGHSTLFYNPYAALPSLHVALAFAISVALASAARRRLTKVVVSLWGPLVTLAVIATGNHFVLDAVCGVLLTAVAYLVTHAVSAKRKRPIAMQPDFLKAPVPEGSRP